MSDKVYVVIPFEKAMRKTKSIRLNFAGYSFLAGPDGIRIDREYVDLDMPGDYGADPLPDGTFRMVPSGEIVSLDERNKRLESAYGGSSDAPLP